MPTTVNFGNLPAALFSGFCRAVRCLFTVIGVSAATSLTIFGSPGLLASNVTVGQNLETTATVALREPAPVGGLLITISSGDSHLLLLSSLPDKAGAESIALSVPQGQTHTQEFYVQGFGSNGVVPYFASAPGVGESLANVTLLPSGVVIRGPSGLGHQIRTTAGAEALKITVFSALIGPSGDYISPQLVAGGRSLLVDISSSNAEVGKITKSPIIIPGGSTAATTEFQPAVPGNTTFTARIPAGFTTPTQYGTLEVTVLTPGIGVLDHVMLGRDLQIAGSVTLGRPAPADGLQVRLTSRDPEKLLLSTAITEAGSDSITINVPPRGLSGLYFLQSIGEGGTATYIASAPGYQDRTATIMLAPSGVVIGLGPPDEAELFRKEAADEKHGFLASLSNRKDLSLGVYTVQLDPRSHRGADITVQPLRPGLSLTVQLDSSNPAVGSISSPVTITGGSSSALASFTALAEGETLISVATPTGFTPPNNATSLKAIVKP